MFLKQNRVNQRETGESDIIDKKTLKGQQEPQTARGHTGIQLTKNSSDVHTILRCLKSHSNIMQMVKTKKANIFNIIKQGQGHSSVVEPLPR